ncbi:MAG: hypothetical protein RL213_199 [Bacteroidota bacterium]
MIVTVALVRTFSVLVILFLTVLFTILLHRFHTVLVTALAFSAECVSFRFLLGMADFFFRGPFLFLLLVLRSGFCCSRTVLSGIFRWCYRILGGNG